MHHSKERKFWSISNIRILHLLCIYLYLMISAFERRGNTYTSWYASMHAAHMYKQKQSVTLLFYAFYTSRTYSTLSVLCPFIFVFKESQLLPEYGKYVIPRLGPSSQSPRR